jgi:NADH-quinone oxidoreductase subunit K
MPTTLAAIDNVWGFQLVAALLFALGLIGFLTRRNLLIILLSGEMMLQGVILNLTAFDHQQTFHPLTGRVAWDGQVFSLFVLVVAAAEAALGLAVVVMLFRRKHTLDTTVWRMLWG